MGSNTINCLNCGSTNWAESDKCQDCGAPLTELPVIVTGEDFQKAHIIKPFIGVLPQKIKAK